MDPTLVTRAVGTSYGSIEAGVGSQASIYFIKTTNGGANWTPPARIDPQAKGHQFFPDIDADNGRLHAVWRLRTIMGLSIATSSPTT